MSRNKNKEKAKDTWVSFDCYGTLINWMEGRRMALRPFVPEHQLDEAVRMLANTEKAVRSVGPFASYRSVTKVALEQVGHQLGFTIPDGNPITESMPYWSPFPDVRPALKVLRDAGAHLAVISNVDDDILKETIKLLEVPFDEVVTSQQVQAYKPSLEPFRELQRRRDLHTATWVHVTYSLYIDVVPALQMGLRTVWINRTGANGVSELPTLDGLAAELGLGAG